MGWLLIVIGASLVVLGRIWSRLTQRAAKRIVETISLYELDPNPKRDAPRMVRFLYLVGLTMIVGGVVWWLLT